jgi:hypothetical protein
MIFLQLTEQLKSLKELLHQLDEEQYTKKITYLGNASIGGHTRHVIELLQCVTNGYKNCKVDYVNRVRDLSLETNVTVAIEELELLMEHIFQPDKQLLLVTDCDATGNDIPVSTTFYREIVYNAEHTIHHLALIRVALREMQLPIVDDHFGMAYSTIKFLSAQTSIQNTI